MGKNDANSVICQGNIDVAKIAETHRQIKKIVESYKEVNREVASITHRIRENWVGVGRNEFDAQYDLLISKIDDFGDALEEIYGALVDAEAQYATVDDEIRQQIDMAMAE